MTNRYQSPISKSMTLKQAGEIWLSIKLRNYTKPKTIECSKGYLKALLAFFGETRLCQINAGALVAYQAKRSKLVGPSAVNHELNALSQILRLAVCWGQISDSYKPLAERAWQKPKTITAQEQQNIFVTAMSDPGLELAAIVFAIMRNTGLGSSELRRARFRDLDLESSPPTFHVAGDASEHDIVPRLIPLNEKAEEAFRRAEKRAITLTTLTTRYPEQYIFPFRVNRALWDARRPASKGWLRKQTQVLREQTGVRHLRPQLWRDQLCAEMLEQGVQPENVIGVMGRVSEKMLEAYKHTGIRAKQEALGIVRANLIAFPVPGSAQR
jgi:integrase